MHNYMKKSKMITIEIGYIFYSVAGKHNLIKVMGGCKAIGGGKNANNRLQSCQQVFIKS